MKSLKSWWAVTSLMVVLIAILGTRVSSVEAQFVGFDEPLTLYQSYPGNTDVVSGGLSFFPNNVNGSFTINVPSCTAGPPTIRGAIMKWYTRWRSLPGDTTNPTFDTQIDVSMNGNPSQVISSTSDYLAVHDGLSNRLYHRGSSIADVTAFFIANWQVGNNTFNIQNFDIPPEPHNNSETYGVGISVVYECPEFPLVTDLAYYAGLDWWFWENPPGMSAYSNALCSTFAPEAFPRYAHINGVFGGQANAVAPFRGHILYWLTGTGTPPAEANPQRPTGVIANNPSAQNFPPNSIWVSSLGQEWDLLDRRTDIVIAPGETFICIQAHSTPESTANLLTMGMSGDLLGTVIRVYPVPQQANTPTPTPTDTPTPTETPTPSETPTLPPGVTPTNTPTPSDTPTQMTPVTNTPGTPGTVVPQGTVVPGSPMPIIRKEVDRAFAQAGDVVTWTVVVSNPNSVAVPDVGFTDVVPNELEILSVSSDAGAANFSGQTVTFLIGSLAPGQSVNITIVTRIRPSVVPPFTIVNLAVLGQPGRPYPGQDTAHVVSVTEMPQTGETPLSRQVILLVGALAGVMMALGLGAVALRRRS